MRLSHRLLRVSLVALLPAAGLAISLSSAASASPHPTQSAAQLARQFIIQHDIGRHAAMHRVVGGPLDQVQSSNWSGYADTGATFSKVSGSWNEPSASCTSTTSIAAFWVGIDGYSSGTVEQDGTIIICQGGTATQYTWWEMYPSNSVQLVSSALRAGDKITASVVRVGGTYTLKVTDSTTTAASFTHVASCTTCVNSSAEWIAEAPSGSTGLFPLANFGTWREYNASVSSTTTTGTISSFTNHEITMVNGSGQVKAQPSALSNGGKNFSVAWKRAT